MLNQSEIDNIQIVLNNAPLLAILHKVFIHTVEEAHPTVHKLETNEVLGANYRAYDFSKQLIAQSFKNLEQYRKVEGIKVAKTRAI